jgi:hypothetical protein
MGIMDHIFGLGLKKWLSETNQDRLEKLVEQFAKEVTEAMVKLDAEVQKLKEEKK